MSVKTKNVTEKNQSIRDYMVQNPDKAYGGYAQTAKKFNVTAEIVRHQARAIRDSISTTLTEPTVNVDVQQEKEVVVESRFQITEVVMARRENAVIKSMKRQLDDAVKDYEELSDAYDLALALKTQDTSTFKSPKIVSNPDINSEATAIVQLSDTHFGKIILPSTVNGLNEHNPEIASKRMDKLAENLLKLVRKERSDVKIDNLVLGLGGDFMENSMLHDHSQMAPDPGRRDCGSRPRRPDRARAARCRGCSPRAPRRGWRWRGSTR